MSEGELLAFNRDGDQPVVQFPAQYFFRKRIFEKPLHRTAHRSRAIHRIESLLHQEILRFRVEFQDDALAPA